MANDVITAPRLTILERAQGALIRDLVRETQYLPHETRDDEQILFIVRRLLSVSSQQSYLDMAARDARPNEEVAPSHNAGEGNG